MQTHRRTVEPPARRDSSSRTSSHPKLTRRTALQAGAIGILGLGLAELLELRRLSAQEQKADSRNGSREPSSRATSVIYIFLSGGLSQLDSFDLKPEASSEIRGEFRPIHTRSDGVQICEHLPLLAARSERWSLVRSLTHPWNDHSQGHMTMLSGRTPMPEGFDSNGPRPTDWPSIASVANYTLTMERGAHRGNLPPAIVLPQQLIHRTGRVIPGQFAGQMGPRWDPFLVQAAARCVDGYGACPECFHFERGAIQHTAWPAFFTPELTLPEDVRGPRFADRLKLLRGVEDQQRQLESYPQVGSYGRAREQAISLLGNSETRQAFDVLDGDPRTLDRYGRNLFGWSLLMARKVIESGVSLVQVNLGNDETWDTHQSAFPVLRDNLFPHFDRSLSALLDDLDASGLLASTLVVVGSEFGRTPRISKLPGAPLAGRDHWGSAQTVLLAGGGVRGGRIIGSTDKVGARPASDPQTPENLAATIYEALGIPRAAVWKDISDRPFTVFSGEPIAGLF